MKQLEIRINDYTYDLPLNKIAENPLEERDSAKLLIFKDKQIKDSIFLDLPQALPAHGMLVFNNTKVIHARLIMHKKSGARIEILCLKPVLPSTDVQLTLLCTSQCSWNCMIGNAKKWKNEVLEYTLKDGTVLCANRATHDPQNVEFSWKNNQTFAQILDEIGNTPLPPYIQRIATENDNRNYQTVYAASPGAVAAPTAGLHFTPRLLQAIKDKDISHAFTTLHVGAGTFLPVKAELIKDHPMHFEEIIVTAQFIEQLILHQGPLVAVGTTSARTLESIYWLGCMAHYNALHLVNKIVLGKDYAYANDGKISKTEALKALHNWLVINDLTQFKANTQLLIVPGYKYRVIDGLITNFHQPKSTLLLMIAAAIGKDWKKVYDHALSNNYRFLSYGDGSLIWIEA